MILRPSPPISKCTHAFPLSLAFAAVLSLSACAFRKDEPAPPKPPTVAEEIVETIKKERELEAANGVLTTDNVEFRYEEMPEPNSYKLIIRWPKSIPQMSLTVDDKPLIHLRHVFSKEFVVRGDEDHKIHMVAYGAVSEAPLSHFDVEGRSPKDFVFNKRFEIKENTTMNGNRLFILPGGKIITNGFGLMINVNKFIVKNTEEKIGQDFISRSHILTVNPGTVATDDAELNGSLISISAKEAIGDLNIAMIGMVNPKVGASADIVETQMTPKPSRVSAAPDPAKQGITGLQTERQKECESLPGGRRCSLSPPVCTRQPTNGQQGAKGATGIRGAKGPRGGSAGTLRINTEDASQLKVEVRYKGGAGGKGGTGGAGFPGEQGGLPGIQPSDCSPASQGAQGALGDPGPPGEGGDVGEGLRVEGNTKVNSVEN